MDTQPKSVKEKTEEELLADAAQMENYTAEREQVLVQGEAAKAEIARRKGYNLNIKAAKDLQVERAATEALNFAGRRQLPNERNVVLLAVTIDNNHAADGEQMLDEASLRDLVREKLNERLPKGTKVAAFGLQESKKENLTFFQNCHRYFFDALVRKNKTEAAVIQRSSSQPFVFNAQRYLAEIEKE